MPGEAWKKPGKPQAGLAMRFEFTDRADELGTATGAELGNGFSFLISSGL